MRIDHLAAARYVQKGAGGKIAIGENIRPVQTVFKQLFNLERTFLPDGSQFDHLFKDGERFSIGQLEVTALLVPGHTPADMAYAVEDVVFVGDTLFMPDVGTARADFPGGDARQLYRSIRQLLEFPRETTMFVCHDTTIRRRHESLRGRRPLANSERRTSTYTTGSLRTCSWRCLWRAMPLLKCRR